MAQLDLKKPDEKKIQFIAQFKEFVNQKLLTEVIKASQTKTVFAVNYQDLDKHSPEMAELLLDQPEYFFEIANESLKEIEVVQGVELPSATKARFFNLPESVIVSIRDLRARHIGKFIAVEGVVRKASEIRPEIVAITWECPDCGGDIEVERAGNFVSRPFSCPQCSTKGGFKQKRKKLVDMRWIMIEEPFELTEGEKPSQVNLVLTGDLTSPDFRRQTDPGNRLLLSGILKDIPKGKSWNVKLDFYLDVNHIEAKETGWERVNVTPEDEALIKAMAADPDIYEKLVGSLAPSLYGLEAIKEAIILQLFGGVARTLPDKTKSRGDIHVLLIGDPASGKSQLLKLVPQIVPRGKYVSGKGTTAAGLTASVSKDEQFMGGWVLEAGAMVLAHKGLLAVDEFEKMSIEDQVAMHEALEQGCYDGGTEIIYENGSITTLGAFVEEHIQGEQGEDIRKDIHEKDIHILSSDLTQIKPSRVKAVRKHKESRLYHLSLSTGQRITLTPNHPVFVVRDGKITPIKGESLSVGDYVPVPKRLSLVGSSQPLPEFSAPQDSKHKKISFPRHTSKEWCEWIGLMIGEGNAEVNRGIKNGVGFCNTDQDIISHYQLLTKKLFSVEPFHQQRGTLQTLRIVSRPLSEYLKSCAPDLFVHSWERKLPAWAEKISNEEAAYLLRGLYDGEGSVNTTYGTISFTSTSKVLAEQVQRTLLRFEIFSGLYEDRSLKGKRKRIAYKVQISGKENIQNFDKFVGFVGRRRHKLELLLTKPTVSSQWNHIPNAISTIENIRKSLRLTYNEAVGHELTLARSRDNISKDMLTRFLDNADRRIQKIESSLARLENPIEYTEFKQIREELNISRSAIATRLGTTQQELWYWKAVKKDPARIRDATNALKAMLQDMLSQKEAIEQVRFLVNAPVEWVRVKSITQNVGEQWVYDVEMNPTGIFIGNGMICHNSVSIAKAAIVATLPAQTSVLAGGNPKFSRFDPYMAIAKQITIPETLLSRFDLKFALRDVPDMERDQRVVDHVLSSRHDSYEAIIPKIPSELIRKYIAYTKYKLKPVLTEEAGQILRNFYLTTRKKAEGGGAMSITMRQFEALIRLSEASAKIQLSPEVRRQDAMRAIELMKVSLRQLGYDPDTGEIDVDRAEGGTTAHERSGIRVVMDIINQLATTKKEIPIAEIEEAARTQKVQNIDEVLDKLRKEGLLFEPSPGFVQKV